MREVFEFELSPGNSVQTLGEVEDHLEAINEEIRRLPKGSQRFTELEGEISKANSILARFDERTKALLPQDVADAYLKLGEGIVGGFASATAAITMFAGDNEEIAETLAEAQQLLTIAMGARQVAEAGMSLAIIRNNALQKLSILRTNLETAATSKSIVVKTAAAVAMKALNAVMSANPVLLLVAGVTALVGALALFGKESVRSRDLTASLTDQLAELEGQLEDTEEQMVAMEEAGFFENLFAEVSGLKAVLPTMEELEERSKLLRKEADMVRRQVENENVVEAREHEVALLKAQGAELDEVREAEEQVRDAQEEGFAARAEDLENLQEMLQFYSGEELKEQQELVEAKRKEYEKDVQNWQRAQEIRLAREEQEDKRAQEQAAKRYEAYRKQLLDMDRRAQDLELTQEGNSLEARLQAIDNALERELEKVVGNSEEAIRLRAALEADASRQREEAALESQRAAEDARIAAMEEGEEKSLLQIQTRFDRELAAIVGNSEAEIEQRVALERQLESELMAVRKQFQEEENQRRREQREQEAQNRMTDLQADLIALEEGSAARFEKEREIATAQFEAEMADEEITQEQRRLLTAQYEQALTEITDRETKARIDARNAERDAQFDVASSSLKIVQTFGGLAAKEGEKQRKRQAALAAAIVLVDQAKATSAAIAAVAANPTSITPAQKLADIFSIIVGVGSAFGQVVGILNQAGESVAPTNVSATPPALPNRNDLTPENDVDRDQIDSVGVQLSREPIRSYVVEEDISDKQGRRNLIETQRDVS